MAKTILFLGLTAFAYAGCGSGGSTDTASTSSTSAAASTAEPSAEPAGGEPAGGAKYAAVQALFNAQCVGCHGEKRPRGGIDLHSYAGVMKGGEDGPIVKPGNPENSLLVQALRGTHGARKMPPRGQAPDDKIKAVEAWIKAGAKNS